MNKKMMTLTFFELYTVYIQNQTHVKKVGTSQNFFLAFIDELEKQYLFKKLLKWANKERNNFNIYNVALF